MAKVEPEIVDRITNALRGHVGHESIRVIAEAVSFAVALIALRSAPPVGCKRITNIYYDPVLAKYVMEREE